MSTWQIWGSFTHDDLEFPTTIGTFRKGARTPGGELLEDLEREFARLDDEDLILLYEFDPIDELVRRDVNEHMPSPEMEAAMAYMVAQAFMAGRHWEKEDEDAADSKDES